MHKTKTLLATGLILGAAVATTASADTIGYWRFEDGAFLSDSSGNGNTLTNTGMTQATLPGAGNGSAFPNPVPQTGAANGSLAAFGGTKDGFSVSDNTSLSTIASNNTFTLEAIINASTISNTSPEDSRYLVSQYNSSTTQRSFSWQINTNEGFSVFLGETGGGFAGSLVSSNSLIASNKDYYVAVSYNAATDTGTFYWQNLTDGGALQSESVSTGSTFSLHNSTEDLTIGFRPDSSKEWSNGALIDEVRVSDEVLSEPELLVNIPEPASLALMGLGTLLMLGRRR